MSTIIRRNERSWAISLISDVNLLLANKGLQIVRAGGETTISIGKKSMFPDLLLYGDQNQTKILQGWEIKLPDTPITDVDFISDAKRKASALGLDSFVIWNFSSGVLYVNNGNNFVLYKQWNDTNFIKNRIDVDIHKDKWLKAIEKIIYELNEYFLDGVIHTRDLGELITDKLVSEIINRNKESVNNEIAKNCAIDSVIQAKISVWWKSVSHEFPEESNMYNAFAKTILLNWINRIIFAHLIKKMHNAALLVNTLNYESTILEINLLFKRITDQCDFFTIFSGIENNHLLSNESWTDLIELSNFLKSNGITEIEHSALQQILEKTVESSKRELNGQFTTPNILAEILASITIIDWTEDVIDPCCGTGTIPKAIIKGKIDRLHNINRAVSTTWASDKFSFPLQISNISMARVDSISIPNKVFQQNVFEIYENKNIGFTNPVDGTIIDSKLPKFNAITSNLPFVPFESISDFDKKHITKIVNYVKEVTGITLDSRSDYYFYIIIKLSEILKDGGRLGIITSNSWLGTKAGKLLHKVLTYFYEIEQIHISDNEKWFNNANVITVISILKKRAKPGLISIDEVTTFFTWRRNLSYYSECNEFKESLINSSLLCKEISPENVKLRSYSNLQIDCLYAMNLSGSALFHDSKWLLDIRNKLIPLSDIFKVVRGERRGWDRLFYPEKGHGIEDCYIRKVLKNARNVSTLFAEADHDAFCCSKPKEELELLEHIGTLNWISRFENVVNGTGIPLPQVLHRPGMHWYEMRDDNVAHLVTTMNPDTRLFYARFNEPSFINQRLIGLRLKDNYHDIELYHALLNSILGMYYIEAVGFGRGLGALDINSDSIKSSFILNPNLISAEDKVKILEKFSILSSRMVEATSIELTKADRDDFDNAVLSAFGISGLHNRIKEALLSMQKMRLSA